MSDERKKIRTVIVEDVKDIRENLEILLNSSPDTECIKAFPNSESAIKHVPKLKPDVILMDINLPGMSGIECTKQLKEKIPDVQIIMLTMYDDSDLVCKALSCGATGYLLKRTTSEHLINSIKEVHNGGSPMSMEIARKVVESFKVESADQNLKEKLTPREWEILGLLSKGMRYKEIADKIFVSVETVRSHLRKIYGKLQVSSATQAVLKYLKNDPNI